MNSGWWYKDSLIDTYFLSYYRNKGLPETDIKKLATTHIVICLGIITIGIILFFGGN